MSTRTYMCTIEGCFNLSFKEYYYCLDHLCKNENCDAPIEAFETNVLYCENHRRCGVFSCGVIVGKENFYCSHPDHCCFSFAQPIPDLEFTCLTSNCLKIQENDSLFCEEHNSCNVIHCSEKPETWCYYCINHRDYTKNESSEGKCIEENCNEKSETCVNLIYNPIHCLFHRQCYHHGCFDKVSADSYFCDSHFPGNQEAYPEFNSMTLDWAQDDSNSSVATQASGSALFYIGQE